MQVTKFKIATLTVIIILAGIVSIHSGMSLLMTSYTIHSSGSIGYGPVGPLARGLAYKSEIRVMFVHGVSFINPDWNTIAQTCKNYNINALVLEILYPHFVRYISKIVPCVARDELGLAIAAAHARDMEVIVMMDVLLGAFKTEHQVVAADGSTRYWTCPTKASSRAHLKALVEEVCTLYDFEGFDFDYMRYDGLDVCYCSECKAKLEQYLGETITVWPGVFAPGGTRYKEFMEFRTTTLNDLVRDMRSWILAIKPNMEFSASVWGWIPGAPAMNRYYLGQDPIAWIKDGNLDWFAPMSFYRVYDPATIQAHVNQYHQDLGGPEGIVPMAAFMTPNAVEFGIPTPSQFAACLDAVRTAGGDGFCLNRYGGPGDGSGSGNPDITPTLSACTFPPIFSLSNIKASPTPDSCTITWTTELPSTSKVEYSTSRLFTASKKYDTAVGFDYWDIDHVPGTTKEDTTPVTNHSITITGLLPSTTYYFRVQSKDPNGIATSKVFTFKTS